MCCKAEANVLAAAGNPQYRTGHASLDPNEVMFGKPCGAVRNLVIAARDPDPAKVITHDGLRGTVSGGAGEIAQRLQAAAFGLDGADWPG